MSIEGRVDIESAGTTNWLFARTNTVLHAGDRVRTDRNSRALIQSSRLGCLRVRESSELTIGLPRPNSTRPVMELIRGFFYFFNRDKAIDVDLLNRLASATTRGTEFMVAVTQPDRMEVSVLDGEVDLRNGTGTVTLSSGDRGLVAPGQAPSRSAKIEAHNVIQWCLYYPAVLDADELGLSDAEKETLRESLAAYRAGDLLGALRALPESRPADSGSVRLYSAALLLSVGEADKTLEAAEAIRGESALRESLRQLVAATQFRTYERKTPPELASEWMAESYYRQSRASVEPKMLEQALHAAHAAADKAPGNGLAWARVAELEFSFGRNATALAALDKGLKFGPGNAQALALQGFILSAQNRISQARKAFERAIAADSGLANGWFGRGLCLIKQGHAAEGRADLLTAAALEPQRALLRSYLGKAFVDAGDPQRAAKELELAKDLDPKDPTVWLYLALFKQQQNRINEAISDLETSEELNDNRSLFRSRQLLEEDRAVRSANLASIYRDAGMEDVSVREASRAVTYDYLSDAAHLFMSDSFNQQRDPTRFNLRYETVWFNELLLANLLAPVGAGRLSLHVSQQEYARFFDADGLGVANSTVARSDNKSITELASQYGTFGGTSYSLDLDYQYADGVRPNNELNSTEWYTTVKQQITPEDTALMLIKYENYHSGDNFQYYNPTNARPYYQFNEYQSPIVVGGWHHEWSPGVHTLIFGGRLENEQQFSDKSAPQLLLVENAKGNIYASDSEPFNVAYENNLKIYTAELQQIFAWDRITLSLGARFQSGTFDTTASMMIANTNLTIGKHPLFIGPDNTTSTDPMQRATGYSYLTIEPVDRLWLIGGLAYDELCYPLNFRNPPIISGTDNKSQLGPKGAAVWQPIPEVTLRGVYAESLGGISLDESYRLEPTQLAGFPQVFRSLISESIVGSVAAPEYDIGGVALDLKFPTRTYAGIQFQHLDTQVGRDIGDFLLVNGKAPYVTSSTRENLDYYENTLYGSVNQLIGKMFAVGVGYGFTHAHLHDQLPNVPVKALASADQSVGADLQVLNGYIRFNHPSGFFAVADAYWYHQNNYGYTPALPGDNFPQLNFYVGYYFYRRHGQITLGILDANDRNYHLNPLNYYAELPRKITFTAGLNFVF
ncbi:MAG TPA: tetratricopeptide repeat protein [Candidatus Acidoferrum sp.]|nr:tetratricopeptide repeat protein [Candidatus Acidoferrum sp.]